ncbi:Melanoma antigen recognized by T-cells 1, partial [Clarias magur]
PAAGIMEIDFFYLKMLLVPLLGASLGVILKCCCMWCHRRRATASELQHCNTPIYVIPIPATDDTDEVSLSSAARFPPPAYDSVIPIIPPPPYSE